MRFVPNAGAPLNRSLKNRKPLIAIAFAGLAEAILLSGCGTPGAPQPPSLKLPERVTDLTAVRAGNNVVLHWTNPKKTTDHLLMQGSIKAAVCRREGSGNCLPAGEISVAPSKDGEFRETLPAPLAGGAPRELDYFIELKSPKGRSAGLSNSAPVLAGQAPGAIGGLSAEVRADGVALGWSPDQSDSQIGEQTSPRTGGVRLHRKLLNPPAATEKKQQSGPMAPATEPVLRDLFVDAPKDGQPTGALDKTAHFGEIYEYTAQRVVEVSTNGVDGKKSLELAGEISAPIRVDVVDTFPPSVPRGLVAVPVPDEKTIDLSWQPDTEEDLAGYIVYRAESDGEWKRISGPQPLEGPAFRDQTVAAGHSYRYAVSAIDLTGHESKRSVEAQEAMPESEPNPNE
ncbi:fibronectin type III domain-containing protein [Acidicapsa acidisoli]|uniref:fibronectin type III domain-containing protein n=1 Tax=Acidicapsa acidisoli TaxID=1615681 RepID=UPI0021DF4382|nr:hypothetical protein [Acidicapsa acidisoli]